MDDDNDMLPVTLAVGVLLGVSEAVAENVDENVGVTEKVGVRE
jgi:hypothetical protein